MNLCVLHPRTKTYALALLSGLEVEPDREINIILDNVYS